MLSRAHDLGVVVHLEATRKAEEAVRFELITVGEEWAEGFEERTVQCRKSRFSAGIVCTGRSREEPKSFNGAGR